MGTKFTRRGWAAAVAASMTSQAPAAQSAPAPAETAEQLLEAARKQVVRNRETLDKFKLDRSAEPAFQFKA